MTFLNITSTDDFVFSSNDKARTTLALSLAVVLSSTMLVFGLAI